MAGLLTEGSTSLPPAAALAHAALAMARIWPSGPAPRGPKPLHEEGDRQSIDTL